MRVILDTGIFFHPERLRNLALHRRNVIVPAIVYAERLRQLCRKGVAPDVLHRLMVRLRFRVEAFNQGEADRGIPAHRHLADSEWHRLARDAMIAGHVQRGDVIWTTNPLDFRRLGIPDNQILAVPAPSP